MAEPSNTSGAAGSSDLPQVPGAAGIADPSVNPETLDAREVPEAPEALDAPEALGTQEASESAEPAGPRRRVPTAVLLLAALLVGPLVGGAVGYAVQNGRPPTPLPALVVPSPVYPTAPADPNAVAEAAVTPLKIDGDLRTLLVPRPDGTKEWDDGFWSNTGWHSVGEKAYGVGDSAAYFRELLLTGFRRDAVVGWEKNDVQWQVELIQYHSDKARSAQREAEDFEPDGVPLPLPDITGGLYMVPEKPRTYVQSTEKYYYGLASARRGDLVMRISVYSPSPINRDELTSVAKQQWERLV
ncbi:hypothetical protein ACIRBX_07050 [Kitasatospora sp. NPDC096147]|uniref:hypothetical protein n=1 Tax=Kitasatospora sp. NPDC096147 TaxID=3364093 RepID=UPI00381233BF